jgi:hypothetical protein
MTLAMLIVACYSIAPKRSEPPPARANALRGIPPAQELLRAKQMCTRSMSGHEM